MPGFVGIVSQGNHRVDSRLMVEMRDIIRHQSWYKVQDYQNEKNTINISLVDLGIIQRDKQPYLGRGGRVMVLLHGEIYNDEVMDSNPLEFIYHLYEKKRLDFASILNGSFVIIIIDEDAEVVLIATDRLASKPVFYYSNSHTVYFAPEMKSVLLAPCLEKSINPSAVADFLANGYFTRNQTLIEGLQKIDSATVLRITRSSVTSYKYWEWNLEKKNKDLGLEYYQRELVTLLRQAVKRCLRPKNTYGILLSGGYDSRGILGCYLEENKGQAIHTISWGTEEDIPNSDCAIAKKLAQKIGANHGFYKLSAEDIVNNFNNFILLGEGLTWYPESYRVFCQIREQQGVDIVLRGDECFGFSRYLKVHDEYTMLRELGLNMLHNIEIYQRILKPSYYKLFVDHHTETMTDILSRYKSISIYNRMDYIYFNVRLRNFLNPLNYVKNFSLESFRPLLDYDILDFISDIPAKYRLGKSLWRKTIVETFPELYEEIAQGGEDISWANSFRTSPQLKSYIYQELIEKKNVFSEFINITNLKRELDIFFASPINTKLKSKVKTGALNTLRKLPSTYKLTHKSFYYLKKWNGKTKGFLPIEQMIIRLLILKVWGDVFLNQPMMRKSAF